MMNANEPTHTREGDPEWEFPSGTAGDGIPMGMVPGLARADKGQESWV